MGIKDNKHLFERRQQMWNSGESNLVDEIFASNYIGHTPREDIEGRESVKKLVTQMHEAFPDFELTYDPIVADEDYVTVKVEIRGTHEGNLGGLAPTGNEVKVSGMIISRIEDGKVVEEWRQMDTMGMFQQLGVQPGSVDAQRVELGIQEKQDQRARRR